MKYLTMALLTVLLLATSSVRAHTYVAYMPVAAPAVAYYAPAPVVAYSPVVATAYYVPQTVYYSAPVPVVVAAPVAAPQYVAPPVAVAPVYGRPVVVRPKVYVVGEPVRNVIRAVTP
jgi:hypothetical protein